MMNEKFKSYLIVAAMVFSIIAVSAYVSSYARSIAPGRTFAVSGEGKVAAAPDIVELSFGVLTEGGKDLAKLSKENSDKVSLIIASLKESGVAEKDIVTQFYNIMPRYQYFSCNAPASGSATPCPPSEIVGYSINQNVFVKIRDLGKAGDIMNGAVSRGANTVSGLSFTVEDPAGLQNQAREKAIGKAKETAALVAASGGFKLGKLISVTEGLSSNPAQFSQMDKLGIGGGIPIEQGTQDVRVTMTLVYEIK